MTMKPGEYPLYSPQSRAAARSLLADRKAKEGEGILVRLRKVGNPIPADRECNCPVPRAGTFAICKCFV